jgi:hypothetical protein
MKSLHPFFFFACALSLGLSTSSHAAKPDLCLILSQAIADAPNDFKSFKGNKLLGGSGLDMWKSSLKFEGKSTSVSYEHGRKAPGFGFTLPSTRDDNKAAADRRALIARVDQCGFGAQKPNHIPSNGRRPIKEARLLPEHGLVIEIQDDIMSGWHHTRLYLLKGVYRDYKAGYEPKRAAVAHDVPAPAPVKAPAAVVKTPAKKTVQKKTTFCKAIKRAVREAPRNFERLIDGEPSRTIGYQKLWTSTIGVEGALLTLVGLQGSQRLWWTELSLKKSPSPEDLIKETVAAINGCKVPGANSPGFAKEISDPIIAIWPIPKRKAWVQIRRLKHGPRHDVRVEVLAGKAGKNLPLKEESLPWDEELKYNDGDVYVGRVNGKGQPHGNGKFANAKSGNSLEGEFFKGKPIAGKTYVKHFGDGGRYEGELNAKAQMHGKGKIIGKDGHNLLGTFKKDQPSGTMTYSNPVKSKNYQSQGAFKLGVGHHGDVVSIVFDPKNDPKNNNLVFAWAKGKWKNGVPDGKHQLFVKGGALKETTTYKRGKVISGQAIYGDGNALVSLGQAQYSENARKTARFPMKELVNKARGEMRKENLRIVVDKSAWIAKGPGVQSAWVHAGTFEVGPSGAFILSVQADKREVPGFRFMLKSYARARSVTEHACRLTDQNICYLKIRADSGTMQINISAIGHAKTVNAHVLAGAR